MKPIFIEHCKNAIKQDKIFKEKDILEKISEEISK